MAAIPEPIRPTQVILERGKYYTFRPVNPVFCMQCVSEITQEMDGKLMIYLGVLDAISYLFVYNDPPQCKHCGFSFRWHVEHVNPPIEVTAEFRGLLDKK